MGLFFRHARLCVTYRVTGLSIRDKLQGDFADKTGYLIEMKRLN